MVPHFFALMDRSNYARWHRIYLVDMYKLEGRHSEVYQEFTAGNHSVSHLQLLLAHVIIVMALEQSLT